MASGLEYFGGNVVGSAADGLFFLAIINFGGKSEISNFNEHIFCKEEVAEF